MRPRSALVPSRADGWRALAEFQQLLGLSERQSLGLVYRGPIIGRFDRYGELVVSEDSVARFVAERRAW